MRRGYCAKYSVTITIQKKARGLIACVLLIYLIFKCYVYKLRKQIGNYLSAVAPSSSSIITVAIELDSKAI